jgi:hypothetical protein
MRQLMECMCTECGISLYLDPAGFLIDEAGLPGKQLLSNLFCTECGGRLLIIGQAGDEPHYRLS